MQERHRRYRVARRIEIETPECVKTFEPGTIVELSRADAEALIAVLVIVPIEGIFLTNAEINLLHGADTVTTAAVKRVKKVFGGCLIKINSISNKTGGIGGQVVKKAKTSHLTDTTSENTGGHEVVTCTKMRPPVGSCRDYAFQLHPSGCLWAWCFKGKNWCTRGSL